MSSSHRNVEEPWKRRMKGSNFSPSTMRTTPLSMALRGIRSHAPIPSMDKMVASLSSLVNA